MMDYRAIIVDFDRTLLHTDKTISEYTVKVLLDLQKSGIRLFAATARPERAITDYCEMIPFDAVTTLNGARTIAKEDVFENPMNPHSAEEILLQLDHIPGMVISLETGSGLYANTDIPIWKPTVTGNIRELSGTEKIYKILASHPGIPAAEINVSLPDDTYTSVADQKLVQIMSASATKWNGIQKMLEAYGITPDQAVYFGDDHDDVEPIRRCGCGVAVSNALECVRDAADYITESNDEDGVAGFLTELVSGNLGSLNSSAAVNKQYRTADKLNTRISIHSKYSTNKQGFGNWITSHYRIRDGASVLELGCGTGDMWANQAEVINRCSRFILSDFSEGMLNKAKETLQNQAGIEYRQIDIQDIPFADHTFDVVIANMMLYHVPDLQKGLREVGRVLKEDGTFYCATYGEHGMMEYICSLFADYQVQNHTNDHFTLQNGEMKLKSVFSDVQRFLYEDSLQVTHVDDMVDYIYSLAGMTDLRKLPRSDVKSVLEKNRRDGILYIPKEYGMFAGK